MVNRLLVVLFLFSFLTACAGVSGEDYEPVTFQVIGDRALMRGVIDGNIVDDLEILLNEHPYLKTIVMVEVEGSVDDIANLEAARYLRKKGLNTHIPSGGMIASGGTDFYLAGVKRTAALDAQIGVHSWTDGEVEAVDFPPTHPEHLRYLEYYREIGIPTEFYWYTISSASSSDVHWMTAQEQERYHITTK